MVTLEEFRRNVQEEFLKTGWKVILVGSAPDGSAHVATLENASGNRRTRFYNSNGDFKYEVKA